MFGFTSDITASDIENRLISINTGIVCVSLTITAEETIIHTEVIHTDLYISTLIFQDLNIKV